VGELIFDDMFVPESAVLGGVGAGAMICNTVMDWERTCLFASHVGQTERALDFVERAVALGSRNKRNFDSDKDLDSLRDHPRFKALMDNL
jgi:alkylation response protein AidB-like acyl-CoA dehydrogenase